VVAALSGNPLPTVHVPTHDMSFYKVVPYIAHVSFDCMEEPKETSMDSKNAMINEPGGTTSEGNQSAGVRNLETLQNDASISLWAECFSNEACHSR
jgi:hypothetical protein